MAKTLSGGEQQMLAIGRGLMADPKLMLIDEMSLGLAPIVVDEIFKVLEKIRARGITVLFVEQNVNRTLQEADRAYILETGRVALSERQSRRLTRQRRGEEGIFRHRYVWGDMMGMGSGDIITPIVIGIMLGGLYALIALGLSLVFGVMRLINLAHGDLVVLSSYIALCPSHVPGP